MRKPLILLIIFIFFLGTVNSLQILDKNQENRNYFSDKNSQVQINTPNNESNFTVSFSKNNSTFSQVFNLSSCQTNFCGSFNIKDLITRNSLNNITNLTIKIELLTESKSIFYDIVNPEFNLTSFNIDNLSKQLNLNFTTSDNLAIKNITLMVDGKTLNSSNLIEKNNFNISLTKVENLTIKFNIYDKSENLFTFNKTIQIQDIFSPKISNIQITNNIEDLRLNFTLSDENLAGFELKQGNLISFENISGKSFSKQIILQKSPINLETRLFVYDINSNSANMSINLNQSLKTNFENKYSKTKTFSFTSDAISCKLLKLDGNTQNQGFIKNSNSFKIDLSISKLKNYNLEFSCSSLNFTQIYKQEFFFDNEKPLMISLSGKPNKNGEIELFWNKSFDNQTEVNYKLYKDNTIVYTGKNLKFTDKLVSYPENYSYYLTVEDFAKNFQKSNEISIIPLKIDVLLLVKNILKTNIVENTPFKITVISEENASLLIKRKLLNESKFKLISILNSSNSQDLELNLELGTNNFKIIAKDKFGNMKEKRFQIILKKKALTKTKTKLKVEKDLLSSNITNLRNNENSTLIFSKNSNLNSGNFFLTILIILCFAFLIFIFFYYKLDNKKKNNKYSIIGNFKNRIKSDYSLEKNLNKVNFKREKKQKEIEFKKSKPILPKKISSNLEKEKLKDLKKSSNKIDFFPISNKKVYTNIKKEESYLNDSLRINNKESKMGNLKKNLINFWNTIFKKEEEKKDELLEYVQNRPNKGSWNSTNEYLLRTKIEESNKKQEKLNEAQKVEMERLKQIQEKEENIKKELNKIELKEAKLKENEENKLKAKKSLDEYLLKRINKKKWLFFERDVERDIKSRNRKN